MTNQPPRSRSQVRRLAIQRSSPVTDKPAAGHTEPRQCDGSDDPRKRCGHHHATGLSNGFGGYECCCGDTWRGAPDECLSGAKTGQPVALHDRVYALIGYLTDECDPANLDACADAVIPAIRESAIHDLEAGRITEGDLAAAGCETRHIIDLRDDGWTIRHPLSCRPTLFDCPVNRAAEHDLTEPPAARGAYACTIEDGRFVVGEAA